MVPRRGSIRPPCPIQRPASPGLMPQPASSTAMSGRWPSLSRIHLITRDSSSPRPFSCASAHRLLSPAAFFSSRTKYPLAGAARCSGRCGTTTSSSSACRIGGCHRATLFWPLTFDRARAFASSLSKPVSSSPVASSAEWPYIPGLSVASGFGPVLTVPNSRRRARTTGASNWLAADFTNSPRRFNSASSCRGVQPNSRASSRTRTFCRGGGFSFTG